MSTKYSIPRIELAGTPKERGITHGQAAKELIEKNIAFYKTLLKLEDSVLQREAQKFADIIRASHPHLAEEMDGIAEGAGVAPQYIYMINARTELLALGGTVASECATFFFKETGLLFENWDWSEPSRELTVLLSITLENGRKILTFAEAGMLGKVGLSSAGFGVAFNYLYPASRESGLPVHALLRLVLEATSFDEAAELLAQNHAGTTGNILLGDASGRAIDFELSGTAVSPIPMDGEYITHTNHYVGGTTNNPEAGSGFLHNSYERYSRAQDYLTKLGAYDTAAAEEILADRKEGEGMLCRNFISEDPGDLPTGTIASIVMDLKARTMRVASDPQDGREFVTYTI